MMADAPPHEIDDLLHTPDLAVALESDRFKQFLDQAPLAIAVAELSPSERIVYSNVEFGRLTGQPGREIIGRGWDLLPGVAAASGDVRPLGQAVAEDGDYIGAFVVPRDDGPVTLDAWSNVIEGDDGAPAFRLVALVEASARTGSILDELQERMRERDVQLRELQHRVKNNLQMITALIRVEAKGVVDRTTSEGFDRLAGRVEALGLLYRSLSDAEPEDAVDLGIYLSDIATAVMRAHAVEGIHLDLQVDTWRVALDVAMPTGLVVNELMTNALKHAFKGREGGTISLHSINENGGCRVLVADDGVGLPEGASWPKPGKLSALIVGSLLQNAKASIDVQSAPGKGMHVTIVFKSADVAPSA
ncbi:MAG: histidine kinase dimerization/phosphoacceptor domain -containing protein [Caulobacteraceae bacterium]